jgi:outer membrane biosynthesis protein TonB
LARRRRLVTAAFSVAAHALVIFALLSAQTSPPRMLAPEPEPMPVALFNAPPAAKAPEPAPEAPAPPKPEKKKPAPKKPPPPRHIARPARTTPPPDVETLAAGEGPTDDSASEVSDAELAGAATAGSGSGSGGGACNMTRWLQNALRKDRMVQAAVAEAHRGKAIRVWNGDWVQHGEQEGKGLAAVREAIMWEVAFAPEACRTQRMHGLVAISLNDAPGSARLVVGSGEWRWSDVLFARGAASSVTRQ